MNKVDGVTDFSDDVVVLFLVLTIVSCDKRDEGIGEKLYYAKYGIFNTRLNALHAQYFDDELFRPYRLSSLGHSS